MQLNERHAYALWALALICLWARRHDEALGKAKKAIAFNPNFAEGHTERGFSWTTSAGPERLSSASSAQWRWNPISQTFGPNSVLRRSAGWRYREAAGLLKWQRSKKSQSGKPPQKSVSNDFCSIETSVLLYCLFL